MEQSTLEAIDQVSRSAIEILEQMTARRAAAQAGQPQAGTTETTPPLVGQQPTQPGRHPASMQAGTPAAQHPQPQAALDAELLPQAQEPQPPPMLPSWPEAVRALPNAVLRTALFGAVAKGARRWIIEEQIAAMDGVEVSYSGQRLDQGDLDVWSTVLHVARRQALGTQCRATSYGLLKLMGKSDCGKNRATLEARVVRLVANAVKIRQGRYKYIGQLIAGASKDEITQEWVIELNPKLAQLFDADQFTQVEWAIRRALARQPMAQWLHAFYSSHAQPYPMREETLLKLSGSTDANLFSGRQTLRKALDAVVEACAAHGEAWAYEISDGLVRIEKRASGPQRRHLARQAKKAPRLPRKPG